MCDICKTPITRGLDPKAFSTTPLHNHSKRKHRVEYEAAKAEAKAASDEAIRQNLSSGKPSASAKQQQTLKESFERVKLWDLKEPRAEAIHVKIMNMIALDCRPFSIVEDTGFREHGTSIQDALPQVFC